MEGGAGALLSRAVRVPNQNYYRLFDAISDHNGNVTQLVRRDTGAVVALYRYEAYGAHSSQAITTSDALDAAQVKSALAALALPIQRDFSRIFRRNYGRE